MQGWFRLALKASSAAMYMGWPLRESEAWKKREAWKRSLSYSLARDRPLFWCRDGVPDLATVSVTVMTCSFSQVLTSRLDERKSLPNMWPAVLHILY